MELQFLGTSAAIPSKARGLSACALNLINLKEGVWLFDCGEATQFQLLRASLKPGKITRIFITHLHGDHVFGLPGLLGTRSFQGNEQELFIYGPQGIRQFLEANLNLTETHLKYNLTIHELQEGIILSTPKFTVEAGLLEHGVPSYGFRIQEKEKPGRLNMDKVRSAGIPTGPHLRQLKSGANITINGQVYHGRDFLDSSQPGRVVTFIGDTRHCPTIIHLAKNATVLVHEATFAGDQQELAYPYFHSSAREAAEHALLAEAKSLILTHLSSRYHENSEVVLSEAKELFPNTHLAQDLAIYPIPLF